MGIFRFTMIGPASYDGDGDVRHRRIFLCAMPVPLSRLNVDNVADGYLAFFLFRCDDTPAGSYHQNLIAGMRVPSRRSAFAEIDDIAAEIIRIAISDYGL